MRENWLWLACCFLLACGDDADSAMFRKPDADATGRGGGSGARQSGAGKGAQGGAGSAGTKATSDGGATTANAGTGGVTGSEPDAGPDVDRPLDDDAGASECAVGEVAPSAQRTITCEGADFVFPPVTACTPSDRYILDVVQANNDRFANLTPSQGVALYEKCSSL